MAESMEEMVTCAICLDRFTNPKLLPCAHTFCLNCLRRIAGDAGQLTCPTCRAEHPIPEHNVQKFNDNLMAKNLLQMLNSGIGATRGGDEPAVQQKTACPDCRRKMHLTKCRHCSEMICADCRAGHVELVCDIKHFLSKLTDNSGEDVETTEGEEIWREFLVTIQKEEKRLPSLFEQLHEKIAQRKEEISLYVDLIKKRLQRLLKEEETPLQRSVQQRISECKTMSTLRGLKNLLDSTETIMASVVQSEGREKFEITLESVDNGVGHVVYGGRNIEIVGAGGPTLHSPFKPDSRYSAIRQQRIPQIGKILYEEKNAKFREFVYGHPEPQQHIFRPTYAVYSEITDSVYSITNGSVVVHAMDSHCVFKLSPLIQEAHHLALTDSGKLLIAERNEISIIDLMRGDSNLRTIGFPTTSSVSQIGAIGNDLVLLDPDKKRIFIYDEEYALVGEINVSKEIDKNSRMAINGGHIYVTGSDVTDTKTECDEEIQPCSNCGQYSKASRIEYGFNVPIFIYSLTGDLVKVYLDIPSGVVERFSPKCCWPVSSIRTVNTDNPKDTFIHSFCVDNEGYVCLTSTRLGVNQVLVYAPDHNLLCKIGAPDSESTEFSDPRGVSLTPDGRLVVCDYGNNRLQIM